MERGNLYLRRNQSLRDRFGDIANEYEKYRFEYPKELTDDIIQYSSLGKKALEIGIGTGKATKPFLDRGYDIVAVEPVENMLEIAKEKFCGENISYVCNTFEEAFFNERFDLIYAASSFQWISSNDRLHKVFDLLKDGGAFARFKTVNIVDGTKCANNEGLISAYQRVLPDYLPTDVHKNHVRNREYEDMGFTDIVQREYYVDHKLSVEDYLQLVKTYTEYLALDLSLRKEFEQSIGELNGDVIITQKCTLFLARRHFTLS